MDWLVLIAVLLYVPAAWFVIRMWWNLSRPMPDPLEDVLEAGGVPDAARRQIRELFTQLQAQRDEAHRRFDQKDFEVRHLRQELGNERLARRYAEEALKRAQDHPSPT